MIELRDYQQDLLVQMHRALASTRVARIMLQLHTGSGKTRIAGELLSGWLKDGRKAVWLTHRKELADPNESYAGRGRCSGSNGQHLSGMPSRQCPNVA